MASMVNGMAKANWWLAPINTPINAPPAKAVQMAAVMRDPFMAKLN